ncbi:hypothetical protein [Novipirellula caenicola]
MNAEVSNFTPIIEVDARSFGISVALWQRAFMLVQFHIRRVTRFVDGGDVPPFSLDERRP